MDATAARKGLGITSVQGSETTVDSLRKSGSVCTAAELLARTTPARYADTRPQRHMHARFERPRGTILDAFAASDDPAIHKRQRRLEGCCVCPMFCLDSRGTVAVAPGFCRDRLCPTCAACRGRVLQTRIAGAIKDMDQTRFCTLTVKCNGEPLAERIDHLYASFRRMRQTKIWAAHVRGGMAVLEVTHDPKTGNWHPHLHVLMDGVFFLHRDLKSAWEEATGDSSIVDIRVVISREAAARYVAAYIAKPADVGSWTQAAICEYALALHGRRLVVAFGSMHGKLGDPDEDGTKAKLVGVLCSSLRLHAARNRRCPYADVAASMLARCGGMCERAARDNVHPALPAGERLSASELAVLVTALKRVGGDESAWLPEIEPNRKFAGQTCGGRRPRDCTLRMWEDDPYTGCWKPSHSALASQSELGSSPC